MIVVEVGAVAADVTEQDILFNIEQLEYILVLSGTDCKRRGFGMTYGERRGRSEIAEEGHSVEYPAVVPEVPVTIVLCPFRFHSPILLRQS